MSVNGSWFFFGFINSSAEVSATSFICFSQFIRANHSSYLFESVYMHSIHKPIDTLIQLQNEIILDHLLHVQWKQINK